MNIYKGKPYNSQEAVIIGLSFLVVLRHILTFENLKARPYLLYLSKTRLGSFKNMRPNNRAVFFGIGAVIH